MWLFSCCSAPAIALAPSSPSPFFPRLCVQSVLALAMWIAYYNTLSLFSWYCSASAIAQAPSSPSWLAYRLSLVTLLFS